MQSWGTSTLKWSISALVSRAAFIQCKQKCCGGSRENGVIQRRLEAERDGHGGSEKYQQQRTGYPVQRSHNPANRKTPRTNSAIVAVQARNGMEDGGMNEFTLAV